MATAPSPTPKSAIYERIASSTGPINRLRARRFGLDTLLMRPPALELYYEAGDPHSHLCAQLLPAIASRLKTTLRIYVVPPASAEAYPEASKQRTFALIDAKRIASAWGLTFPNTHALPHADQMAQAAELLAGITDPVLFTEQEHRVATALFSGSALPSSNADTHKANERLQDNARRRLRLGHYLPAMWQFNGEWFWGLDRLNHLANRLRARKLLQDDAPLAVFDAAKAALPELEPGQRLEFFFSFRSPYSYLAALDLQRLAPDLPIELRVRPVLPMAMRGMPVPLEKRLYIVRDVKRQADQLGYPFGRIADPLGAGAERCLNSFPLAEGNEQQLAFLTSAGRAIWSQGIDVATDEGLRYACERAGLEWAAVKARLDAGLDLDYAETNRQALFNAGLWGVPSYRIGNFATWGQDRLWMVQEMLRRAGQ